MDFGSCQVRAKAANAQNKKNMIVELPSLIVSQQYMAKLKGCLCAWDGKDHHHHLTLNTCSVDLWDCSAEELNVVDAFPGLACVCGARAHLESAFHDHYILKCYDTIILSF